MGKQFRHQVRHRIRLWLGLLVVGIGVLVINGCAGGGMNGATSGVQLPPLRVDGGQLRSHLQTLATERYTTPDLARTRTYLTQQLQTYGYEPILQPFGTDESSGTNLSVVRRGASTPGQKILVGAHYDTVAGSPGADDNASAVATALEVARLFSTYATDKTLQIVFFDQEERQPAGDGLLGSTAFVKEAANLTGLDSVVILEMLGYACSEPGCQSYPPGLDQQNYPTQGDFISVIGNLEAPALLAVFEASGGANNEPASSLKALTLAVPGAGASALPDLFRSDHVPFWNQGIGAVMVSDTANFRNPHYHQPSDTVDTLDLVFLEQTAQYVVDKLERLLQVS